MGLPKGRPKTIRCIEIKTVKRNIKSSLDFMMIEVISFSLLKYQKEINIILSSQSTLKKNSNNNIPLYVRGEMASGTLSAKMKVFINLQFIFIFF